MGKELEAEGGERAEPEVARGAAADTEEDGGRAGLRRSGDELAGAERRGLPRVTLVRRQERQAAGRGHLDHGDLGGVRGRRGQLEPGACGRGNFGPRHKPERGLDRGAPRAGDGNRGEGALGRTGEDLHKTLAAVRQRAEVEGPVGVARAQRAGGRVAGRACREGVLELVEGEEDAHGGGRIAHGIHGTHGINILRNYSSVYAVGAVGKISYSAAMKAKRGTERP